MGKPLDWNNCITSKEKGEEEPTLSKKLYSINIMGEKLGGGV
jgi:hypothetical protein